MEDRWNILISPFKWINKYETETPSGASRQEYKWAFSGLFTGRYRLVLLWIEWESNGDVRVNVNEMCL